MQPAQPAESRSRPQAAAMSLGGVESAVEKRLARWTSESFARRMWAKDYTLWAQKPDEITNRLGWLTLPEVMRKHTEELEQFVEEVRGDGISHVVLLGMGGSSLAPDVFQSTFGNSRGYPELKVLDSTHPAAVRAVERSVDLSHTLFVVSSKSGTTIEPLSFMRYFWTQLAKIKKEVGRHFVAISDPGTPLGKLGRERGFQHVFEAVPDVGGRYSALTHFGLVPAALIGVDVKRLLDFTSRMAAACAPGAAEKDNPGLALGAALGELALAGRNKVTFITSPSLGALPIWFEQLIAESTGKNDKGIVPVAGERLASPEAYGQDRVFVYLRAAQDTAPEQQALLSKLEAAGHPVIRIEAGEILDLGQEFFRWEVATAAAGAVMGIHPFNQPDVELAKDLARQAMSAKTKTDDAAVPVPADSDRLPKAVSGWLASAKPGDYFSLQAYLAPTEAMTERLTNLQQKLRDRTRLAATAGYGPRFLHSTGQLHKGGPNTGLFVQFVDAHPEPLAVPETDYTFSGLIEAQALGDYQALKQRGRRILRVHLGKTPAAGLDRFNAAL